MNWVKEAAAFLDQQTKQLPNTLSALKLRYELITKYDIDTLRISSESTGAGKNKIKKSENLMESFKDSMAAGYRAIKLRKYVHDMNTKFSESKKKKTNMTTEDIKHQENNDSHHHCIQVLEKCYASLSKWWKQHCPAKPASTASNTTPDNLSSFNLFSVLESLEEIEVDVDVTDSISSISTTVDEQPIEDIGEAISDLRVTALCLLYDMMTAMQEVKKVWQEVRQEKIHTLTAVAVTMTAFRQIQRQHYLMQLKYPSMVSGRDFYDSCLMKSFTPAEFARIDDVVELEFFTDQLQVLSVLSSMTTAFQNTKKNSLMIYRRGYLGEPFHEAQAPLRRAQPMEFHRFFAVELCYLFNNNVMVGAKTTGSEKLLPSHMRFVNQPLTNEFYQVFIPHFEKGIVSVPELFLTHCWVASIQILQDPQTQFLGRSLYMLRKLGRDIDNTTKEYLNDPTLNDFYDNEHNQHSKDAIESAFVSLVSNLPYGGICDYVPLHANPILQGCVIWDKLLNYMHCSTQLMQGLSSYHRATSHIYHAMKQEGHFNQGNGHHTSIPILDNFVGIYNPYVFVGGNPAGVNRGEYEKQYYLASHSTALGLSKYAVNNNSSANIKVRQRLDPEHVSKVFRMLYDNNYQDVSSSISTSLMSNFLQQVRDCVEEELFTSRYLSLKLTTFHLQFYRLFTSIRAKFPMLEPFYRVAFDDYLKKETASFRYTQALEISITSLCLKSLDEPTSTGAFPIQDVLRFIKQEVIREFSPSKPQKNTSSSGKRGKVASGINFDKVEDEEEVDKYFHFSTSRKWLVKEFGEITAEILDSVPMEIKSQAFSTCMDCIEEATEDLEPILAIPASLRSKKQCEQLATQQKTLKSLIKTTAKICPGILTQFDLCAPLLANILDHAIGGIWRDQPDVDFVEWLLQMWAYNFAHGMSHTHLHVAIITRQYWAVSLLLREDTGKLINYQSPRDGNTALHYAAIAGAKEVMTTLSNNFCDGTIRNRNNQLAVELIPSHLHETARAVRMRVSNLTSQEQTKRKDDENQGIIDRSIALNERNIIEQQQVALRLREEERRHTTNAFEIAKAEQARNELFAMLDDEDKAAKSSTKKNKKKKGKK